jgi:hypothetical protein
LQHEIIPEELVAFKQAVAKPLVGTILPTLPPRRRPRHAVSAVVPRRSSYLAKKVDHRTLAVAAAQNLLMRKLKLLSSFEVAADDLDRYAKLFEEGLSEDQVRMIQDLFMSHVAALEVSVVDEET